MRSHKLVASAILVLSAGATPATAVYDVPGIAVEFDGWRYIPVFEDNNVHSFVVLDTEASQSSSSITSMWFVRDDAS